MQTSNSSVTELTVVDHVPVAQEDDIIEQGVGLYREAVPNDENVHASEVSQTHALLALLTSGVTCCKAVTILDLLSAHASFNA